MLPDKKLSHLRKELPGWIEFHKNDLEAELIEKDSLSLPRAYFDLAHNRLANDEVDEARKLFQEGAKVLMSERFTKPDVHIDVFGEGHKFPIYGYLGGKYEFGRPLAKRYGDALRAVMSGPGYLSPAERIYEDFYLLLDEVILDNTVEINALIESLDKRLSKFKITKSLYKPTGLRHKYPLFGKEMVKAILNKDEDKFSVNLHHWSQLLLNAISVHDPPDVLAEIELIFLYDLALGNGMKPKIDTPFIPKSVIKNGYWNKPL